MKRLLAGACALALLGGGTAFAQTVNDTSGSSSGATSGSISGVVNGGSSAATSGAANAGNAQQMTVTNTSPANQSIKTVPTVYAPALTTTLTDTCMGSTSIGASAVGGGVTFGTSWEDKGCNRRLNAREVANLTGDREAARAILCQDKTVYDAFIQVGRPCPGAPGYAEQGPMSYEPPPPPPQAPPPPVVVNNNLPAAAAEQSARPYGTMAPIPNPDDDDQARHLKEPRN